ncbi:Sas10/Utp3/C1D family-domain-containing protein [Lentinula aff. detonsa]|uniref:Exosome complex protein n=1 Tax=Lentinula aff. detonsa TaxID=2804958 RepID=A0AA38TZD6_9AGAR|nr:Sas10/Utp3/C1D family-domain-containing protein [Lentinula aff. detonsa]
MASAETQKAKSRLKVLSSSLDEVEAAIAPLLSGEQTLPEILLTFEPLEQAKLQTVLPYLVYDLIFIYLRTRGIDPKSHPVVTELERVRQYFEKIKNAENPAVRGTQVDKAAANRFIKHAISQAQIDADASGVTYPRKVSSFTTVAVSNSAITNSSDSSSAHVPVQVTSKMLERQDWQKRVDEAGSEEENLEGWEDGDDDQAIVEGTKPDLKGKGKAVEQHDNVEQLGSKRLRPAIDPFAAGGHNDSDNLSDSHPTKKQALSSDASIVDSSSMSTKNTPATKAEKKKNRKKQKTKESKSPGKAIRVAQLVTASQGVAMPSNLSVEDNDIDMDEVETTPTTSTLGTPVAESRSGDGMLSGKMTKKQGKGKRKERLS